MWWSQMQKPANYAMSLMRWKKVADTTFWLDNSVCLCSGLQVRNKGTCINAQWLIEHEKKKYGWHSLEESVLKWQNKHSEVQTMNNTQERNASPNRSGEKRAANENYQHIRERIDCSTLCIIGIRIIMRKRCFCTVSCSIPISMSEKMWCKGSENGTNEKKNTHTKLRKPIFSSTPRHTFWKFQASRAIFELRSVFFSFFGLCTFLLPIEKQKNSQERLKTRNRTWFRATFHRNVSITSYFNVIHIKMCIYKYVRPFSLLLFCTWTEQFCAPVF